MSNKCNVPNCKNLTEESKILPGHWLAECAVHIGHPCVIEGCGVRQEWHRVYADGKLGPFFDDVDDPADAVKAPYCWLHDSMLNEPWGYCQAPGCTAWTDGVHKMCSEHGGKTLIPRTVLP